MPQQKHPRLNLFPLALICLLWVAGFHVHAQSFDGPPTVQDCLGAIPVCQPVYTTTTSYTGHGNVYPEIRNNSLCPLCMDGEKNDVFYVITVQTSGTLRFTLTPNNPSNDYDWSLFNMTNAGCDQIYTNASMLQVSCNSYGVTGTNGPTGINTLLGNNLNCNGPGASGQKFNKDLTVLSGQTYVLNVSNWSSTNQSGYTLDFSGSTASIFDITPATVDSIQQTVSCAGSDSLFVRFSENVKCTDVFHRPEKFSLTGPAGTYTITDVTSADCRTGASNGRNCTLKTSPALAAGTYSLHIIGDIRDLCDNICVYRDYPFQLTEINAPVVSAGNDTSVANGAIITLHGLVSGGAGPYNSHWEPAGLLLNPNVLQPVTINMGASTNFILNVTDNAGCHGTSDILVTVVGGPLGVYAAASPGTICAGASALLNAMVSGGSGNYSYSWTSNPPGFTSNLHSPTVFPVSTTAYSVQVNDGFSNVSGTATVVVNAKPVAGAGSNSSIPYGTNAQLNGTGSGGSGDYSYYWTSSPPGFSSTEMAPLVVNLSVTTIFSLVVTDNATGCVSEPSLVMVSVTGSPLACNPGAFPPVICAGEPCKLHAMVGGGSGNYTYSWTSTPAGFTSQEADPQVTPGETTNYLLTIGDGFNGATGQVNVHVNPVPKMLNWPADTTACIYEIVKLDAGNQGSSYYWSNGATTQSIEVQTTGLGFDTQFYRVKVINEYGCLDSADSRVSFSFSACAAIDEIIPGGTLRVYPNPGNAKLHLEIRSPGQFLEIIITTIVGEPVLTDRIDFTGGELTGRDYDLSQFPKGLYLVTVKNNEFSRAVKFINR
ncbi:MAG: T9SS type A sorting domain-containing protein [Bacteroidetes bacterium]|nr:T9SS type A sorting domain-containing protein [Bacteroidota bacterium]